MPESTPTNQTKYVRVLASDQEARAKFLANPDAAAKAAGITLDPEFSKLLKSELVALEKDAIKVNFRNPYIDIHKVPGFKTAGPAGRPGTVMNAAAVAAGAAVVSAAAAVVSAVCATYQATKWRGPSVIAGPQIRTRGGIR